MVVTKMMLIMVALLITCAPWCTLAQQQRRLVVPMTMVPDALAKSLNAYCLDGSLPAYHFHKGVDAGANNWLLQFEGGGWCNDLKTCTERAKSRRGSTKLMAPNEIFNGILSNDSTQNPDFFNWNRVKIRYCDGASFTGNAKADNGGLHCRGQSIWQAVMQDLLPKGLSKAEKGLLSGCSAGGMSTFFHCMNFTKSLPPTAKVKCLSDAGFFIDIPDITNNSRAKAFYDNLISFHGVELNLGPDCTTAPNSTKQCFFPQYVLPHIETPYFLLNAAYDTYQLHHNYIPPIADRQKKYYKCITNLTACTPSDFELLQGLRTAMVKALDPFMKNPAIGMYINSCFAHGQSEFTETWLRPDSPKIKDTTIAKAVGDWYFDRNIAKLIDEPYPADKTCHNII